MAVYSEISSLYLPLDIEYTLNNYYAGIGYLDTYISIVEDQQLIQVTFRFSFLKNRLFSGFFKHEMTA